MEPLSFGLVLAVAALLGIAAWRGLQLRRLATSGVPVTGRVVRMFTTGRGGAARTRRVVFTYVGPDGREYRRAASVSRDRAAGYEVDGPIALYCLPDDPGVSAEAWMVEAARAARAKRQPGA